MLSQMNGYTLRSATEADAVAYYEQNFCPLDAEVTRLTGSRDDFTREEVISFFLRCVCDPDRFDFLILAPDGRIIGETVINEWEKKNSCANFRICLFHPEDFGKGIGTWATRETCRFAFTVGIKRLTLSVFPFNTRAIHVYEKIGFTAFGMDDGEILMELRGIL